LPGGDGDGPDLHSNAGDEGNWWTSTEYDSEKSYYYFMGDYEDVIDKYSYKGFVFSVRCLKD
jgi:uncharacterized protein (TIGR02145 family)